ncbi:HdeD family acid-resistance protein [Acetatifactor aquisgranensis]|uniref:HdeD family acid-resistance protein n=1 Tax=Acetatifactor aquisgranensis TaxID=2941233 RepID=UPI00204025F8|nr:DUF308 domain-containing protein [Acetatifactor aquisgranensis]MCI8543123.1 hypothetical protein [Lachnospiraceae bacterium]
MKKLLKQIKWETLLTSALYIVLGVVALIIPDTMVKTLGYLIGILLIVAGAVSMICYLLREASLNYYRNGFGYGLVSIAVGILFLYKVEWIISLVPAILGILVVASGCRKLQDVIDMKRMNYGNWVAVLILAAVNVILGAALIFNSLEAALFFLQLVGAGLIFSGVTDCITCFYLAKEAKGYFDNLEAVDSTFTEVADTDEEGAEI